MKDRKPKEISEQQKRTGQKKPIKINARKMTAIKCLENIELPSFIEIWSGTQTHSNTQNQPMCACRVSFFIVMDVRLPK